MSILTEVLHEKITPQEGVAEALQWAGHIIDHSPDMADAVNGVVADLKHAASNAADLAGTALGATVANVVPALEASLDTELAKLTGGASIPFNKFVNDGADRIAAAIKAEVDAFIFKWKASLAVPPAS